MALALCAPASQSAFAFKLFGITLFGSDEDEEQSPDAQTYKIDVTVADADEDLADRIRAASLLYSEKDGRPPSSTAAFLSRARAEYGRIVAALYTEGYYGGTVAITVAGRPLESIPADAKLPHPVAIKIAVDAGPPFTFGSIALRGRAPEPEDEDDRIEKPPEKLGLVPGHLARSTIVLQSEQALVDEWRQQGHPKAEVSERNVVADHKSDRLNVGLTVKPGPSAVYGPVSVTGTSNMNPEFVARQSAIVPGEPYDSDDIDRAQRNLRHLQVFNSSRIVEAERVGPDGTLPIEIAVAERPLHVFGFGGFYSTLDGAGVEGYWEHRNLFGQAERLRFEAQISGVDEIDPGEYTDTLSAIFTKPGVITPMTDLIVSLTAFRQDYDPYTQDTLRGRIGLAHEFSEELTGTVAFNGEVSRVDDAFGKRDFKLVSLPGELIYDGSDNKLEPTRGFRARLSTEPMQEFEFDNTILASELQGSTYLPLDDDGRFVVAARAAVGSIVGAPNDEIPDDRLFFAGGGGSVRGYEYRSLGPRLPNGEVYGGRSLVEGSLEFRARVTETIGIVPFVDAGNAFAPSYPDFSEKLKVGVGLGLRYYTGLGPIRVDAAVPVSRDPGQPHFALYIGLGESF